MMIFKRNKLNLTWIESFPIPAIEPRIPVLRGDGRARERRAVAPRRGHAGKEGLRLEILGSFPATTPVE